MTTEPLVGASTTAYPQPHTERKTLVIILAILVLLSIGITLYWVYGTKQMATTLPQSFALYENETYSWYLLSGNEIAVTDAPAGVTAGVATYPGKATLSVTSQGLKWTAPQGTSTYLLVERTNLSPETSFVSVDGSLAVLYNEVTNSFDVFKVTYEGAYVSYVGSIVPPTLPSYPISGAALGDATVILHTGEPDTYQIYSVSDTNVRYQGTAAVAAQ